MRKYRFASKNQGARWFCPRTHYPQEQTKLLPGLTLDPRRGPGHQQVMRMNLSAVYQLKFLFLSSLPSHFTMRMGRNG